MGCVPPPQKTLIAHFCMKIETISVPVLYLTQGPVVCHTAET